MFLQHVLTALFALSGLVKVVELAVRRRDRLSKAVLAASFLLLAAGLGASDPSITGVLERVAAGSGKIVYNGLTDAGLYLMVVFFLRAVHGGAAARRLRRETAAVVATVVALVVLVAVTPAGHRGHTLSSPYLGEPPVLLFYLVGGAYFVHAFVAVIRLIWVHVRSGRGPLAWALRLIALGLAGLTVTSLVRIARVLDVAAGGPPLAVVNTVNFQLNLASSAIVSLGLAVAGWAQALALLRGRAVRRRQFRALEPLWTLLTSLYPEIVLDRAAAGTRRAGPATRRLYRRVLECRDGLLRSGPVLADAAGTTDLSRLTPETIARHLRALADRPPRSPAAGPAADLPAEPVAVATPAGSGLGGDVEVLVAISRALPPTLPPSPARMVAG